MQTKPGPETKEEIAQVLDPETYKESQPQQVKIEDLTAEQIQQAITQTHAQVGLLFLTEQKLSQQLNESPLVQQLNSLRQEIDRAKIQNELLYAQAEKLGVTDLPGVKFG